MSTIKHLGLLLLSTSLLTACSSQAQDEPLTSSGGSSQATVEGVPGGVTSQIEQVSAVVSDIDYGKRSFTLEDAQGNKRSFTAGPEMINFPQLKVGDKVSATVAMEQVVFLREPGAASEDGAGKLVAAPPAGSKPGMLVADTVEVTALVKAIDTTKHTATLEFPDGTRKTVQVRPDVQLKPEHLNSQVVIRLKSALAIRVEAQ